MSLKRLGLSDYESRIYTALLDFGRCDAKAVAKASGVPPTAVYPNLKSLESKGFVHRYAGDKYLFEAAEPGAALSSFTEKKIEEMNAFKEAAIGELKKHSPLTEEYSPIKLSYGKETSVALFDYFSRTARRRVYVLGWRFSSSSPLQSVVKRVASLANRSVDVKIIFHDRNERTSFLSKELRKIGAEVKFRSLGNFSIILVDDKICKLSLKSEDRKQRVNLLLEDRDLARAFTEYFIGEWKKANS